MIVVSNNRGERPLFGPFPDIDPEILRHKRNCCAILSVALFILGVGIIAVVAGALGLVFFLGSIGPAIMCIVWSVICAVVSYKHGQALRLSINERRTGVGPFQRNHTNLPANLQITARLPTQLNHGFSADTYPQGHPNGIIQTQPYPGQFSAQYSSPTDYSSAPPSYVASTQDK